MGVLLYEMIKGSPPWPYKSEGDLTSYFDTIATNTLDWSTSQPSPELRDLIECVMTQLYDV
jgi:hypothetical protein